MRMPNRRRRNLAIVLALTGLPLFLLYVATRPNARNNAVDRAVLTVTAPLQRLGAAVFGGLGDLWDDYLVLTDVKRENRSLVREVARLRQENRRLAALAAENQRLRDMLGFRDRHDFAHHLLAARVTGRSITPFFRVVRIRLDAGEELVKPGMPVITREGVVGTVERVAPGYSDVLLMVDARSSIDVVSRQNRVRGIVKGRGEVDHYAARMEYTLRTDELKEGEVLVTSGMGRRFPRNLVVGTVASIKKKEYGLYQEVAVTPAVDFSRIEEVFVVTKAPEEKPAP